MHFGVRPWEIPLLTPMEINGLLESLERMAREARKRR